MKLALDTFDSRLSWLCVAAAALVASAAQPARAQECAGDDDCAPDYECAQGDSDAASSDDRAPCVPDAGDCEPVKEPVEPVEEPPGNCVARRVTCESDADCPAGLSCELDRSEQCSVSRSVGGDGGVDVDAPECTVTVETTGECVFELVECDANADCEGGLVCTALGSEQECSSEPGMATCPPGSDCPEPEPTPEPECSAPVIRSYCFPEPMACEDDAACDAGARCVQLPNDWEHGNDAPVGWQGVSKACFPEGFARAIEGSAGIAGGGGVASDESASKGDSASANGSGAGAPQGALNPEEDADDTSTASKSDCAVTAPGAAHAGLAWPYACALAGRWLARRRRALQLKHT